LRYCNSCILPDTRPNLVIGADGKCNACVATKNKADIDWCARERQFCELVERIKEEDNEYDCLIPVSGGKDSTWQVVQSLEYGLKPLAVTWATPARTELGRRNLENLINLGVDHIDFRINPNVEKRFMLESFRALGSTAVPMHMAMFQIPPRLAVMFGIKLIIWGENPALEYGGTEQEQLMFTLNNEFLETFGLTNGTTAENWVSENLSRKDLGPYFGPADDLLNERNITAIFLGSFFEWDVEKVLTVARAHGFESRVDGPKIGYYDYAGIDCNFISLHHWMKWPKFGFTRLMDNLSLEIRHGRVSREEALNIVGKTGVQYPSSDVDKYCEFLELEEGEFQRIAESFRNQEIWSQVAGEWRINNFIINDFDWGII